MFTKIAILFGLNVERVTDLNNISNGRDFCWTMDSYSQSANVIKIIHQVVISVTCSKNK